MKPALALEIPQVIQKEGHFFAGHGNNQPEKVIKNHLRHIFHCE
jgi:hypothetical protein